MTQTATFAAGCFWGVEHTFRKTHGVLDTRAGYTGGVTSGPRYEEVCTGKTGHAEAVRITFDPQTVSYGELLDIFWKMHDPTLVNRQGPDTGEQYRTAIFTHSDEQTRIAVASRKSLEDSGLLPAPVATTIEPAGKWWDAEEYHQQYHEKRRTGK